MARANDESVVLATYCYDVLVIVTKACFADILFIMTASYDNLLVNTAYLFL